MKESAEVAVGRLFEGHGARLYRLGVRFCGSADEAHFLVQDVLQAFRSWKQFDSRSSPSTWLTPLPPNDAKDAIGVMPVVRRTFSYLFPLCCRDGLLHLCSDGIVKRI